jgi:polyhydroxybutyrate depolymerase
MMRFIIVPLVLFAAACGSSAPVQTQDDAGVVVQNDAAVTESACTGKLAQPQDATWTVLSSGISRTANVHVPPNYDKAKATPVVLNFHGYTSNADQEALLSGMNAKADAEGFVVVYPEGLNSSWNAGACCGVSAQNGVADVQFVSDLIDSLEVQLCVDAKRVFATGMSNGAFLSHRLGCELSDRIAAIAPVAGVLGIPQCNPKRAVPVMHFHGTADPLVPYDGSPSLGFPPVPDTFAGWAARDGCTGQPATTFDKGDAHCATYEQCGAGATVTLCTIDNGGHTWPGGFPIPSLGNTSTDISATDEMWTFFTKHPLP